MGLFNVLDIGVDFMDEIDADVKAEREAEKLKIDEACIKCKDKFGRVNLGWIADAAGVNEQKIIVALRGSAIFQDPAVFEDRDEILLRCQNKRQFQDAIDRLKPLGRIKYHLGDGNNSSELPFKTPFSI